MQQRRHHQMVTGSAAPAAHRPTEFALVLQPLRSLQPT
jgi:hypothetical protein